MIETEPGCKMAFKSYTFSSKLRSGSVMSSSSLLSFWDGKRLRKTKTSFKTAEKNFDRRVIPVLTRVTAWSR